jgi:hypothetical protein
VLEEEEVVEAEEDAPPDALEQGPDLPVAEGIHPDHLAVHRPVGTTPYPTDLSHHDLHGLIQKPLSPIPMLA